MTSQYWTSLAGACAAHAQFHECEDRLLVGRVREAEARLTVPGVEEFRVVTCRLRNVVLRYVCELYNRWVGGAGSPRPQLQPSSARRAFPAAR